MLSEATPGTPFLTSCLFTSQAASTLNQDYFRILSKVASEETLACVSAWRMSLGELLWKLFCTSCVVWKEQRTAPNPSSAAQEMVGCGNQMESLRRMLYGALVPFFLFFFFSSSFFSFPFLLPPAGKLSPQCVRAQISLWQCRESGEEAFACFASGIMVLGKH